MARSMRLLAAAAALGGLLAAALVLGSPAAAHPGSHASGAARACGTLVFTPGSEDGAFAIRAREVGCATARRVARASRALSVAEGPYRYRARGFACRGRFEEEELPQVRWRCTRDDAVVRFTRG